MISVYRDYDLPNDPSIHAHIEINPVGFLDIELIGNHEHLVTQFDDVSFEHFGSNTKICGKSVNNKWKVCLTCRDAEEIAYLIEEAKEEFEVLMRDLG